jgi:membrane fusion protein (multidrug efflux system)
MHTSDGGRGAQWVVPFNNCLGVFGMKDGIRKFWPGLIVMGGVLGVVVLAKTLPARQEIVPPSEPAPVNVEILPIEPLPELPDRLRLHAVVEPNRIVSVAAEVSGQVAAYGPDIEEGKPVAKDAVIVELDKKLLKAELDRAQAQLEFEQQEFTRIQELFEKGVSTQTELDRARTNLAVAEAAANTAREMLDRTTIKAPIAGILNDLPQEIGQYVQPGDVIGQIVDIDTAKVRIQIPEKDIRYFKLGDKVTIQITTGLGTPMVEGAITFIGELADPIARTTPIEVTVSNEQHLFRSGQIVTAFLTRRVLENAIMIPLGSVIPLEEGRVVYVVDDDNTAERRDVELGLMRGRYVQVISGLATGDRLIVNGHRFIGPGQAVAIVDSGSPLAEPYQPSELSPSRS